MLERQRAYCDFLDDGVRFGLIKMRIHSFKHLRDSRYDRLTRQMGDEGGVRHIININDLQRFLPERHKALSKYAVKEVVALQGAIKEKISYTHPAYVTGKTFKVGFEGAFGSKHLTPRYLFLSRLKCLAFEIVVLSISKAKLL